ncbi:hypothetical protein [Acinetobacter oleivorans]
MRDIETIDLEEDKNKITAITSSEDGANRTLSGIKRLKSRIINKKDEFSIPTDSIDDFNKLFKDMRLGFSTLEASIKSLKSESKLVRSECVRLVFQNIKLVNTIDSWRDYLNFLRDIVYQLNVVQVVVSGDIQREEFLAYKEDMSRTVAALKNREVELINRIEEVKVIVEQTKNIKIHDYYALAAEENENKSELNKALFIVIIFLSLASIWFCLVTKAYFGLSGYDYYFFKGSLVLTSITLITYFLKQSVKYQKIADQCKQTKLELEAFPSYVANLSNEDPLVADLRKELATKYFGREIDNKSNDETSNILQDQMKNTTEMVKAAMEVLKKTGSN